jgi:hypothetical protein
MKSVMSTTHLTFIQLVSGVALMGNDPTVPVIGGLVNAMMRQRQRRRFNPVP